MLTLTLGCGGVAALLLPLLIVAPSVGRPSLRKTRRLEIGSTKLRPIELHPGFF